MSSPEGGMPGADKLRRLYGGAVRLVKDSRAFRRFEYGRSQDHGDRGWDEGHDNDPTVLIDRRQRALDAMHGDDIAEVLAEVEQGTFDKAYPSLTGMGQQPDPGQSPTE